MPSYLQLESEQVWHDQLVAPNMTLYFIDPLRAFYGLGPDLIGAPGDNNHLQGRHRSPNWDRTSRYSTSRTYSTTDSRDHAGDQDWYRGVDIGVSGSRQWASCRRLDAAVRSGALPGVAEWFGTFDGETVVGWFEGHPSSSDDSHLFHTHVGVWTQYADDVATMKKLYEVITGTGGDMPAFVKCPENGGFYAYGLGAPKWYRSEAAYNNAKAAFGANTIVVNTLNQVRDTYGYIPGDTAAVAAGTADVVTDAHGNVLPVAATTPVPVLVQHVHEVKPEPFDTGPAIPAP